MPKRTKAESRLANSSGSQRTALTLLADARKTRRTTNKLWEVDAGMFRRISPSGTGKTRSVRLVNGHAYKIASAGAALRAAKVIGAEADRLRIPTTLGKKFGTPWVPSLTRGAVRVIDQFLTAYAQEATRHGANMRKTLKKKRIDGKSMEIAYDVTNSRIFAAASPVTNVIMCDQAPKRGKRADKSAEARKRGEHADEEA